MLTRLIMKGGVCGEFVPWGSVRDSPPTARASDATNSGIRFGHRAGLSAAACMSSSLLAHQQYARRLTAMATR